jgi:S-DNA-T family DNA segregation ATPase FtsK/SpoIIIE
MFVELGLLGAACYGASRWIRRSEINVKKKWEEIMHSDDNVSKYMTKVKPIFEILDMIEKEYGWDLIVSIPVTKEYSDLEKMKGVIESAYGCRIIMQQSSTINTGYIRLLLDTSNSKSIDLQLRWDRVMRGAGAVTKQGETFTISNIKEKELYGYDCDINVPSGYSYDDLITHKDAIDKEFGLLHCDYKDFCNGKLPAKIITKPLPDNYSFKPIELKTPYQLYLGNTYYYEPVIADMKKEPHLLYSGTTNSGKSVGVKLPLINLAHCFSPEEVGFFFIQNSSKVGDFDDLLNLKHVRYYAYSYDHTVKLFEYLINQIKERSEIFTKKHVKNIYRYNEKVKPEERMPIYYCIIEEFAELMPGTKGLTKHYDEKVQCIDYISTLSAQGRSSGIYLIVVLQRPDKVSLDPLIKSNLTTRVAGQQLNDASSLVVVDTTEATKLKPREFIVRFSGQYYKMKTPWVNEDKMVYQFCKDKLEYNHKFIDLFDTNKNKTQQNNGSNEPIPFEEVAATKQKSKGDIKYNGILNKK